MPGAGDTGYRFLFAHHPHALFVYERATLRICAVNDAAIALYGYARDEFLALTIADIRPAEDVDALRDYLKRAPRGLQRAGVWRHKRKDGAIIEVEVSSHDTEWDGQQARLVTVVDVTERRRAESALRESERRFRSLLESVDLIAVTLDVEGRVTFVNEYTCALTGYQAEEMIGANWFELVVPEDQRLAVEQSFRDKLPSAEVAARDENDVATRRGERRTIQWTNTVLRSPDGRITGTASIGADITVRRRAERQRMHDAFHDHLTGLPNRAVFRDRLDGAFARATRDPSARFAVLLADIDGFHLVNEGMGHAAGDELIASVAAQLGAGLEAGDTVARLGGDEFGLLLEQVADPGAVEREVMRIQSAMQRPFTVSGRDIFVNVTFGIAIGSADDDTAGSVLRNAGVALNRARARGERWAVFHPAMRERAVRRFEIDTDLRRALERDDQLHLAFQPIVTLEDERLVGFEALVRWQHPQRGNVSPAQFVPIAEESNLIGPLGRWVLRAACRQLGQWSGELGNRDLYVSVNVSAQQLGGGALLGEIDAALAEYGIAPQRLQLELTESSVMDDPETAIAVLTKLRERGISVAIDDFGTGFSSLSYLARLPVDTIKIDRSFVVTMGDSGSSIVETIASLARNLELATVAEGIEERVQVAPLLRLGCMYGQGYLFARPMAGDAALAYLRGQRATTQMPKLERSR